MIFDDFYDPDYPDLDYENARAERDHERQYSYKLMAHPDCRDPDHPGCERCEPMEDEA